MTRQLTHGYRDEIEKYSRDGERWFLIVETSNRGTVIFCQAGEDAKTYPVNRTATVYPWLRNVTQFSPASVGARDVQVYLELAAWQFYQANPLINRKVKIYRYRNDPHACDLVHEGRFWDPIVWDSLQRTLQISVVGYPATVIDGEIPPTYFTEADYPQCPSQILNTGIPLLVGTVYNWTPILIDAGGWGYLSEDLQPLPTSGFGGYIPIADGRAQYFRAADHNSAIPYGFSIYLQHLQVTPGSLAGFLQDHGAGWLLLSDAAYVSSELCRCPTKSLPDNLNYLRRGMLGTPMQTLAAGAVCEEVGLVDIDGEIALYRSRNAAALYSVRSMSSAAFHAAGALVKQYQPSYRYLLAAHGVRKQTLTKENLYWFDPSTEKLAKNEYQAAVSNTAATVDIKDRYVYRNVNPNAIVAVDLIKYELLPMATCAIVDDTSGCWSSEGSAIDETGVNPVDGEAPTTYAQYQYQKTTTLFPASGHWLQHSENFTNPELAYDGDIGTNALVRFPPTTVIFEDSEHIIENITFNLTDFSTYPAPDDLVKTTFRAKFSMFCIETFGADIGIALDGVAIGAGTITPQPAGQQLTEYDFEYDLYVSPGTNEIWQNLDAYGNRVTMFFNLRYHHDHSTEGGWNPLNYCSYSLYDLHIRTESCSDGYLRLQQTADPATVSDTISTELWIYAAGGSFVVTYDGAWGSETELVFSAGDGGAWFHWMIPGSDTWDAAADWKKAINIKPLARSEMADGRIYDVKMVHNYTDTGYWANPSGMWGDGVATYTSKAGQEHIVEIRHNGTVTYQDTIERVRIYVSGDNALDHFYVGVGSAGDYSTVSEWKELPPGNLEKFVDVTDLFTWSWRMFNSSDASGKSIFLKTSDAENGKILTLNTLQWQVLVRPSIDPDNNTLVMSSMQGYQDSLQGPFGGWIVENPADVEKWIIQQRLQSDIASIDIDSYTELRDAMAARGIKAAGAIYTREAADEFLKRFRDQFGYSAVDIDGKLAVKIFPTYQNEPVAILDASCTSETLVGMSLSPMSEVCNFPIANYRPAYYSGNMRKIILPGIDQQDSRQRLRRNWDMGEIYDERRNERVRKQWRNSVLIDALIDTDPDAWAIASASYAHFGKWLRQYVNLDMVHDETVALAILAYRIRRYAFQRPLFEVEVSPRVAEILTAMDVVWLVRPELQMVSNFCVPGTYIGDFKEQWAYKCAVLSVQPDGEYRVVKLEALMQENLQQQQQERMAAGSDPSFAFGVSGAGWKQGVWRKS